jgi:hypothetical protein
MQCSDLSGVQGRRCGPAQPLAVLASMGQASPSSFLQNLPFEGGENGQHCSHRTPGRRGQIQRFGQRDETDAEMVQFLQCRADP